MRRFLQNTAVMSWVVVVIVGLFVAVLVPSLHLPSRLSGGQSVLDKGAPAFDDTRVAGDRAGITMVSAIVDLADPIATAKGGGADEVPKLVAFVSEQTGLSRPAVLAALQKNFPHTTSLLQAVPLEAVSAELPRLVTFLADNLHLTKDQVVAALNKNFPHLAQSIDVLPTVTGGWNHVAGTDQLTRFDGSRVRTVPQVRDYFAKDVVPVLEREQSNFHRLDTTPPPVDVFAPLLILVGVLVIAYGGAMIALAHYREPAVAFRPVAVSSG